MCKAYAPPNFSLWCGATWPVALRLSTLFVMNETLLLGWLMLVAMLVVLMCGVLMFELVGRRRRDLLYQRRLVGGLRRRDQGGGEWGASCVWVAAEGRGREKEL